MFIRKSSTYYLPCSYSSQGICLWQQFVGEGEEERERKLLIFVWSWFFSGWQILWWQQKIFCGWGGKRPTEKSHLLHGVGSRQTALTHSSPLPSQAQEGAVYLLAWLHPVVGSYSSTGVTQRLDAVGGGCSGRKVTIFSSDKRGGAGHQHQCHRV